MHQAGFSRSFRLDGMSGDVDLRVKPLNPLLWWGGGALAIAGTVAAVTGADFLLNGTGSKDTGTAALVVGSAVVVGAVVMIYLGAAHVDLVPGRSVTGAVKPRPWLGEF